jgi:hypothetical protein
MVIKEYTGLSISYDYSHYQIPKSSYAPMWYNGDEGISQLSGNPEKD